VQISKSCRQALSLWLNVGILAFVLRETKGFSQGQIIFNDQVTATVVAPVYNLDPAQPGIFKSGNTSSGTPAGSQTYAGALLAGSNYTAQVFARTTNRDETLLPMAPPVFFRSGSGAGFVVAPNFAVTVPGIPEGQPALVQLRAWNNRGGTITNWQQVLADPQIERGESIEFTSPPLGGLFRPPPNLIGLQSFNLYRPADQPLSLSIRLAQGLPEIITTGPTGRKCRVTYVTVLDNTTPSSELTNFVLTTAPMRLKDLGATNTDSRFYRGELLP
jgi:hypothetical protein